MSDETDHVLQIKDALKEQRDEKKMTNQDIADKSGLSLNTVTNYFSSRSKAPSIYTVGPLCAALGVSLDKYFGIVADSKKQQTENEQIIEKQNIYINQLTEKLRIYKKILNIFMVIIFVLIVACGFIAFCYPIQIA
ncbi:MAG: helix-turn-helix domain-containing protein [Lachnospiraceae bacterium]